MDKLTMPALLVPLTPAHSEIATVLHAEGFPQAWSRQSFESLLTDRHRCGALALSNNVPVGLIMLQFMAGESEVLTLVVAEAHRQKGHAHTLMKWAIKAARHGASRRLILEVSECNPAARGLYDKLGFSQIGRREAYYHRAGGLEAALILALPLVVQPAANE